MLRMAHRIATTHINNIHLSTYGAPLSSKENMLLRWERLKKQSAESTSVVIDNVVDYYSSARDGGKLEWRYDVAFPKCLPFNESIEVEFKVDHEHEWQIACLLRTTNFDKSNLPKFLPVEYFPEETRYVCIGQFVSFMNGSLSISNISMLACFNSEGELVNQFKLFIPPGIENQETADSTTNAYKHFGRAVLLAFSFANCKNVTCVDATEQFAPKPKWIRQQKAPQIRYHVLNIDPMKQVLKTEGRSDEVGIQKALHICRGHFSRYTEEKPLFGKVAGTFWVPSHVRGKAENGIVLKDYSVNSPVKETTNDTRTDQPQSQRTE